MPKAVQITGIEAIPVRLRLAQKMITALGDPGDSVTFGIVKVSTDAGITGIGEISIFWNGGGAPLCETVRDLFGPALIGSSALDISAAIARMDQAVQFSVAANPAKAAVEMALHDIVGKALDVPVYVLLGGRMRDRALLSKSIMVESIEGMVAQAREFVAQGYKGIKVKVGIDPVEDVAAVTAIRHAIGPHIVLRVDANMGWRSAKEALAVIDQLAPLGVRAVEQPLAREAIEEHAYIRARSPLPIMVDESLWGPDDAHRVIQAKAADLLSVYVSEAGGLRNAMRIFEMAQTAGLRCVIGSMPELGVGIAACAHLAVAAPDLFQPMDGANFMRFTDTLIQEELDIRGGSLAPSDRPGLGVSLDEARLNALRID
jgi:L-alanine-DL-glutamate epimerase-like enolase superfamily enzyme